MLRETDPDPEWVAALAGTDLASARRALREAAGEEGLFRHLARRHREGGRKGYVEIDAPLELYALTRLMRPKRVVEVGVSSGVSSAYLLAALQRNRVGSLDSIDLPSRPRKPRSGASRPSTHSWTLPDGRSTGWAVPRRLRAGWTIRLGDKADELPKVAADGRPIDLFVYDVPHEDTASYREFRTLDPRMAPGAVAIVDHGPSGDLCSALARWAKERGAAPARRAGLGLFGFRCAALNGAASRSPGSRPRRGRNSGIP